jgi:predicted transcriptional regulator
VEVGELEGIVPLPHGRLAVLALPADQLQDPTLTARVRRALLRAEVRLLLTFGLEAGHVVAKALPGRPTLRFGVAAAIVEATRLGVDCTLVVTDRDLPRVFEQLEGPDVPPMDFLPLGEARRRLRVGRR